MTTVAYLIKIELSSAEGNRYKNSEKTIRNLVVLLFTSEHPLIYMCKCPYDTCTYG